MLVAVCEREFRRLDQEVGALAGIVGEFESVRDAQHLERGHPLRRRWELRDLDTGKRRAQRGGPLPRVAREIVRGHQSAGSFDRGSNVARDRAAVERVGTVCGE